MAPARKHQKHASNYKIASGSYVHPSLGANRSSPSTSISTAGSASTTSVNERIEYLRRTQTPRARPEQVSELYLSNFASRPAVALPRSRRVPGPPPPRSWLEDDSPGSFGALRRRHDGSRRPRPLSDATNFGCVAVPDKSSLLHHALKAMAEQFEWHVDFDHVYLSVLPVKMKMQLLRYIAVYGSHAGLTVGGLKCLFASSDDSGLLDSSRQADATSLDLGGSIGHSLSLQQLSRFLTYTPKRNPRKDLEPTSSNPVPDSWDDEDSTTAITSTTRFPTLTHLSLAYPSLNTSWTDLLTFSRSNLAGISSLSLAGWPRPALSSTSTPAASQSSPSTSLSRIRLNADEDDDDSEAAYILQTLARHTSSLTELDLSDCHDWLHLLRQPDAAITTAADHRLAHAQRLATRMARVRLGRVCTSASFDDDDDTPSSRHVPAADAPHSLWTAALGWRRVRRLALRQSAALYSCHYGYASDSVPASTSTSPNPQISPSSAPPESTAESLQLPPPGIDPSILRALLESRGKTAVAAHQIFSSSSSSSSTMADGNGNAGREEEAYRVVTPSASVRAAVEARVRRREWLRREVEAVKLECCVRRVRRALSSISNSTSLSMSDGGSKDAIGNGSGNGSEGLSVDYGWDRSTLFAPGSGYEAGELAFAGI